MKQENIFRGRSQKNKDRETPSERRQGRWRRRAARGARRTRRCRASHCVTLPCAGVVARASSRGRGCTCRSAAGLLPASHVLVPWSSDGTFYIYKRKRLPSEPTRLWTRTAPRPSHRDGTCCLTRSDHTAGGCCLPPKDLNEIPDVCTSMARSSPGAAGKSHLHRTAALVS